MAKYKFTSGDDAVTLTNRRGDYAEALGGADTVIGSSGSDTVYGGEGADSLSGGDGNDRLFGDAGDDVLSGGRGDNLLEGGNGVDTLDYGWYGNAQPIYVNLAAGYAVDQVGLNGAPPAYGGGETFNDRMTGIENVNGATNAPNYIVGDVGANLLSGGGLADTIIGSAGNDTISPGAGVDLVAGGTGEDTFVFRDIDGASVPLSPSSDHSLWQNYEEQIDRVVDWDDTDSLIIKAGSGEYSWIYDGALNQSLVLANLNFSGNWVAVVLVDGNVNGHIHFTF